VKDTVASQRSAHREEIVGVSRWSDEVRRQVYKLGDYDLSVMITGPTGTGKELIARAIHACGNRADKPFIPIDCASLIGCLLPSHLFGHLKGAFTGAHRDSSGCFQAAEGGTIFLDEIGELDVTMQASLLRVLQERSVIPVGGVHSIPVDVRVIAATNRDLQTEVGRGNFREDLYYRLNVGVVRSIPLAERPDDIEVLAAYFLEEMSEQTGLPRKCLSRAALDLLVAYHWPGNVRQLRNVLERSVVFAVGELIDDEAINRMLGVDPAPPEETSSDCSLEDSADISAGHCSGKAVREARRRCPGCKTDPGRWLKLDDLERYHIHQTLEQAHYNQTIAADMLGITTRVLSRKIKRLGIDVSASHRGRPRKEAAVSPR